MSIRSFFFPRLTKRYLLRVAIVAAVAYVLFRHVCVPMRMVGGSMEPTYHDRSMNFCWRFRYRIHSPRRQDVVILRLAGERVMMLKRVVAFEGETVEFRSGQLFVEGRALSEPYVVLPCNWDLPPRVVHTGRIYVVGDNRSMQMSAHAFGAVEKGRIVGAPLW